MKAQEQKELLGQHLNRFPHCAPLKSLPAITKDKTSFHDAYDIDDLQAELGNSRFNALIAFIIARPSSLICYGHRNWPLTHAEPSKRGAEVHCVKAQDLDDFLKGGG